MDEWSILAKSYEEVLLPRFEPLYDRIAEIIIAHIASRETNPKWKILDFGTGFFFHKIEASKYYFSRTAFIVQRTWRTDFNDLQKHHPKKNF